MGSLGVIRGSFSYSTRVTWQKYCQNGVQSEKYNFSLYLSGIASSQTTAEMKQFVFISYGHTNNFSAIWRLSPLTVTGHMLSAF
jgi:hypothetical protein